MADKKRQKEIPEEKLKVVSELSNKMKKSPTILVASIKGLPSSQFHEIKKNLRGKAEIVVAKKSLILRAINEVKKASVDELEKYIGADISLFFSDMDPFELSSTLADNQSPAKAKPGDILTEDVEVEPGPTDLLPGPAISELSNVGLKVAVEGGKLAIKQGAKIAKAGEPVKENVASVMAKLGITPLKVGFEPIAVYDAKTDKVYVGIKIDKKKTLEELRELIGKALRFAVGIEYPASQTLPFLIAKANTEEKALEALIGKEPEKVEEKKEEEKPSEENPEEKSK